MDSRDAFADKRRTLVDQHTRRLTEAAGEVVTDPIRDALREVANRCAWDTVDTLVTLMTRLRAVAPRLIATRPVVAFIRYGQVEAVPPVHGAAITADGGRFNVHSVFWDERTARWEGSNGRYGLAWETARAEMNCRVDLEAQP
jgi:hypothetical protein